MKYTQKAIRMMKGIQLMSKFTHPAVSPCMQCRLLTGPQKSKTV